MSTTWTCQRVSRGVKCGVGNDGRARKCRACGKDRPKRRTPAHTAILTQMPYEAWVELYGPFCGICGRSPSEARRLDRDHDHASGKPRGLLCHRDNRALPSWVTPEWLEAAAAYLRHHANREANLGREYMPGCEPKAAPCSCGRAPDPGVKPEGGCWCTEESAA